MTRTDRRKKKWPGHLHECLRCLASKEVRSYAARGLCTVCYSVELRGGRLEKWIKLPTALVSSSAALEIVRTVGKTEGARMLGIDVAELEQWVFDGTPTGAEALIREVLRDLKSKEHRSLSGKERESLPYRISARSAPWGIVNPDTEF